MEHQDQSELEETLEFRVCLDLTDRMEMMELMELPV